MTEQQIRADERAKVVNEILSAIESEYDLNYGEILINPSGFYDLVEGYLPSMEVDTSNYNTKPDAINLNGKQVTIAMVGNSEDTAVNLIHKVMNGEYERN